MCLSTETSCPASHPTTVLTSSGLGATIAAMSARDRNAPYEAWPGSFTSVAICFSMSMFCSLSVKRMLSLASSLMDLPRVHGDPDREGSERRCGLTAAAQVAHAIAKIASFMFVWPLMRVRCCRAVCILGFQGR